MPQFDRDWARGKQGQRPGRYHPPNCGCPLHVQARLDNVQQLLEQLQSRPAAGTNDQLDQAEDTKKPKVKWWQKKRGPTEEDWV